MRAVQTGPLAGLIALLVLLGALAETVGLGVSGWALGLACGLTINVGLARGLSHHGSAGLGPADRVTLTRATLACGVAALTADSFTRPTPVITLVSLTAVALALDAVDGWLARLTESTTPLGARFDMEVDAFLILVLSVYVGRMMGAWVLAIGVARYVFVAALWLLPWLRGTVPPRYWCKVVAAIQGVALAVVAADVLPRSVANVLLGISLALLAESFGREVWQLWRVDAARPTAGRKLTAVGVQTDG